MYEVLTTTVIVILCVLVWKLEDQFKKVRIINDLMCEQMDLLEERITNLENKDDESYENQTSE